MWLRCIFTVDQNMVGVAGMMRPGLCNPGRAFAGRAAGTSLFRPTLALGYAGPGAAGPRAP
jgi:hypothetical protein